MIDHTSLCFIILLQLKKILSFHVNGFLCISIIFYIDLSFSGSKVVCHKKCAGN